MNNISIAHRLMEIDNRLTEFQSAMQEAGVDVSGSSLQYIDIPTLVSDMFGLSDELRDCMWEEYGRVSGTKKSHTRFINAVARAASKYPAEIKPKGKK